MIPKRIKSGTVLVRISNEDKERIFQKSVVSDTGEESSFIVALKAGSEMDEYFSQSVHVATVIQVADDVKNMQVGDVVVIDYTADSCEDKIAFWDDGSKVLSLLATTKYHEDDKIAYASMRTRRDTYTWRKGDVEMQSLIYAILRNGILIPNIDYILLEHKNLTWEGQTKSGIHYMDTETEVVVRKIIGVCENSDYKVGDTIAVESMSLFERSIEENNFDIIMDFDVLATIDIPA